MNYYLIKRSPDEMKDKLILTGDNIDICGKISEDINESIHKTYTLEGHQAIYPLIVEMNTRRAIINPFKSQLHPPETSIVLDTFKAAEIIYERLIDEKCTFIIVKDTRFILHISEYVLLNESEYVDYLL